MKSYESKLFSKLSFKFIDLIEFQIENFKVLMFLLVAKYMRKAEDRFSY